MLKEILIERGGASPALVLGRGGPSSPGALPRERRGQRPQGPRRGGEVGPGRSPPLRGFPL